MKTSDRMVDVNLMAISMRATSSITCLSVVFVGGLITAKTSACFTSATTSYPLSFMDCKTISFCSLSYLISSLPVLVAFLAQLTHANDTRRIHDSCAALSCLHLHIAVLI